MYTVTGTLAQHIAQIMEAVEGILNDARADGQVLQDVQSVVRGDRIVAEQVKTPGLWIYPGADLIEPSGGAATIHNVELIVVAVVQGYDPRVGAEAATDLAARAYDVLLADRTWRGTVHEVRPVRFDPSAERFRSKQLYAATAVLTGRVRRRE